MKVDKTARIKRLLVFYLSGTITDPEKILQTIALEAGVTRDEVWVVYTTMTEALFYA